MKNLGEWANKPSKLLDVYDWVVSYRKPFTQSMINAALPQWRRYQLRRCLERMIAKGYLRRKKQLMSRRYVWGVGKTMMWVFYPTPKLLAEQA